MIFFFNFKSKNELTNNTKIAHTGAGGWFGPGGLCEASSVDTGDLPRLHRGGESFHWAPRMGMGRSLTFLEEIAPDLISV